MIKSSLFFNHYYTFVSWAHCLSLSVNKNGVFLKNLIFRKPNWDSQKFNYPQELFQSRVASLWQMILRFKCQKIMCSLDIWNHKWLTFRKKRVYTSPRMGFYLTSLVVIGTGCRSIRPRPQWLLVNSEKSGYHTLMFYGAARKGHIIIIFLLSNLL